MMKRMERVMSRENRIYHERMWMRWQLNTTHDLSHAVQCAMWRCSDRQRTMHSHVRVDVLCVEVSLGGHVVIGVGRVIVQRHHVSIINYWILTFVLVDQLCTCSQTVCCDRQFFPLVIYCTLLHLENGSFEVLCLPRLSCVTPICFDERFDLVMTLLLAAGPSLQCRWGFGRTYRHVGLRLRPADRWPLTFLLLLWRIVDLTVCFGE